MMKKFVVGMIVGILIAFSASAHAETLKLVGKVVQQEMPVSLNGEVLDSKGAIIDGVTYVPVRAVAEALDLKVGYDSKTGVSLTSTAPEARILQDATQTRTKEQLESELAGVSRELIALNQMIVVYERNIETATTDVAREQSRQNLAKAQSKRQELEERKNELEAQLATYDAP